MTPDPLETVAEYLRRYFKDEPNDLAAASASLRSAAENLRQRWEYCRAFRQVMGGTWPEGTLMNLVVKNAKRDVWSDAEAMDFLRKAYDDAYLDEATDYDELDQEQRELFGKKE